MDNQTIIFFHPELLKLIDKHSKDDSDINELLNEIYKTSTTIKELYQELFKLLSNPNTPDFEKRRREILYNLSISKLEEEDLYHYLEDLPLDLLKLIDKISHILGTPLDDYTRLIYRRIQSNLHIILMLSDTSFLMLGESFFKSNRSFQFLTDNGMSYEEAVEFFRLFKHNFERSISYRYTTIINEEITKEPNPEKKKALLRIKLRTTFVRGNEVEDDLIASKFTTVKNDLTAEMSPTFGAPLPIKEDYTNIQALISLHTNIEKLSDMSFANPYTKEMLMEFKTFLLYLSEDNYHRFIVNLNAKPFKDNQIKKALLSIIDSFAQEKNIHYQDSEQFTGGQYAN